MRKQNRDSLGRFAKNEESFMDRNIICPCGMIVVMILIFLFVICINLIKKGHIR